ncbi:disulfide bond formation protein B [Sphingobium subterraneum]|uniref:Disulfide bond formation protein DsbB n=1 Tax=Sphingobium subterraneum TaxID=627688 RepID=A0A841J1E9_9SPHN|nr:disulfide bond formation protein B [Sphingobium subterraneum]MBB6124172.1 disulfide bond formation protein DsbB [Sphingobium subterraneum]
MTRLSALSAARLLAIMTPVLLLGGAIGSQYIGGLFPCEMCMWQRWPHLIAIAFALCAIGVRGRPSESALFTALAALAMGASGGIGAFHAGVEYGWWQGLTACSTTLGGTSTQDVLDSIMAAPVTRCDVAPWTLAGISLAGFNALISLGSFILIMLLLNRSRRPAYD